MPGLECLFAHEKVVLFFFGLLAILGVIRPLTLGQRTFLWVLPAALSILFVLETGSSRSWSRVTREWASFSLILAAYWSLDLFAVRSASNWHAAWVSWDRVLLNQADLKALIEACGRPVPLALESLYLSLYAFPPLSLAVIYWCGARARSGKFLLVLFLGTLTAYSLIPLFPVASPRAAYPGLDLPAFASVPRSINVWLLDHLDIRTGVFPSGHVAVAFSCAFGLLSVLPDRRGICYTAFVVASLVFVATVYGRYHYAVDGLASIAIAALAWRVGALLGNRRTSHPAEPASVQQTQV